MNEKKRQSRSQSRRKSSYAPIMLTSKSVKPSLRQQPSSSGHSQRPSHNPMFRTKLSKFTKQSQLQVNNKQDSQTKPALQVQRMNLTQYDINYNKSSHPRNSQFDKTFSHSSNRHQKLQVSASQLINNNKQLFEQIYNDLTHNQKRQFERFYMKQPTSSAVVNVQFNEGDLLAKATRKNNINGHRYNVMFAYGNNSSNATVSSNRPYKSVSTNSKILSNNNNNQIKEGYQQVLIQINDDNKGIRIVSSSLHKNQSTPGSRLQNPFPLKDPTKKMMLSHKQKPFDLTFTNFKQKIYQKKLSKLSHQKPKYTEEWNEYLNKYYLNIKKVSPLVKYQEGEDGQGKVEGNGKEGYEKREAKSSAQIVLLNEISKMSNHPNRKTNHPNPGSQNSFQHLHSQKMQRIRSTTLMTTSKTTTALSTTNLSPLLSPKKSQKQQGDHHKIQSDIVTKRISTNRKDYFVFSMGDASNQNKIQNPNIIKFSLYKDFLFKVNFSNGLYVRFPDDIQKPYKFFVGKGNNSAIIKGIMRRRFWWQLVDKISPQVNFVWTQLRVIDFVKSQKKRKQQNFKHLIQPSNHYQPFTDSSQKQLITQVYKQTYHQHKKIFRGSDLSLWLQHYKHHSKHQQKFLTQSNYNILQKRLKPFIKRKRLNYIDSSLTPQLKSHNHFECNYYIGNKKALFYAMRKYYRLYQEDPFDYIPLTYHISGGLEDPEFNEFLDKYNMLNEERTKNKNSELRNIWIVKPGQVTNRGRGITVCATLDEIKIRLKSKQKNRDGSLRTYILQKYIQKPLLYQKRKFDIRHYMFMTCVNGSIKGYWYQEGYIRTTSTQYNIRNCKDLYTHLTNDAIQKTSSDYGKYEKGNKISYQEFQKYLAKTYKKEFSFFDQILPKMKKLATDAMRATYSIIEPNWREHNFELFGLDFMLDQSMKVYLIQCNTNPCLQLSCPLLAKIISGLIQNVFKICIDPLFPPPYQWPNSKKFQMGDNALQQMKFELVFDEAVDGKELEKLYGAEKGLGNKIGKVEEEEQEYEDDGGEDQEWNEEQQNV